MLSCCWCCWPLWANGSLPELWAGLSGHQTTDLSGARGSKGRSGAAVGAVTNSCWLAGCGDMRVSSSNIHHWLGSVSGAIERVFLYLVATGFVISSSNHPAIQLELCAVLTKFIARHSILRPVGQPEQQQLVAGKRCCCREGRAAPAGMAARCLTPCSLSLQAHTASQIPAAAQQQPWRMMQQQLWPPWT